MDNLTSQVALRSWLSHIDEAAPLSTYQGTYDVPFQRWFKFKEAYSPLLVKKLIESAPNKVVSCLDPCGGCGTTAVTSMFMGIRPTVIEVNPFLADVVEAKLSNYDLRALQADAQKWLDHGWTIRPGIAELGDALPDTFVERASSDRWLYSRPLIRAILGYRKALLSIQGKNNRRLLRVVLGSVLVGLSNVVVNGKGRRYRQAWETRQCTPHHLRQALNEALQTVMYDIARYPVRSRTGYEVLRGSCLARIEDVERCDIAIFSPPYPNSFDYTDVYNIELWMLDYIRSRKDEQKLRRSAIRSHVQVKYEHDVSAHYSPILAKVRRYLDKKADALWSRYIPEMVESYFADMREMMLGMSKKITPGGTIAMVVGDSAYAGVRIPVADILSEIAKTSDLRVQRVVELRNMRASAQQGWRGHLKESVVVLRTNPKPRKRRRSNSQGASG